LHAEAEPLQHCINRRHSWRRAGDQHLQVRWKQREQERLRFCVACRPAVARQPRKQRHKVRAMELARQPQLLGTASARLALRLGVRGTGSDSATVSGIGYLDSQLHAARPSTQLGFNAAAPTTSRR
jgi:hypothetical protein